MKKAFFWAMATGSLVATLAMVACQSKPFGEGVAQVELPRELPESGPDFDRLKQRYPAADDPWRLEPTPVVDLDQNWKPEERWKFYRVAQGSHIMPLEFAWQLMIPGTNQRFLTNANLAKYGFVPQKADPVYNPLELPVGFTVDGPMAYVRSFSGWESRPKGQRMLGVNCALCHTANLKVGDKLVRIDGGQTLARFQEFLTDLDMALKDVWENEARRQVFLARVQSNVKAATWYQDWLANRAANDRDPADMEVLKEQLLAALKVRADWNNLGSGPHGGPDDIRPYGHAFNHTTLPYGPGRIDAFNAIFNQVLARDLKIPSNAEEANSPVSSPVIWDATAHDFVQWNGLADNSVNNGGPLARNIGQVLGVFGKVDIDINKKTEVLGGFCSTARRRGLKELEGYVSTLWSPKWSESEMGPLDWELVKRGRDVYVTNCKGCHGLMKLATPSGEVYDPEGFDRTSPNRRVIAKMVPMRDVGTNTWFNDKALSRMADTGVLKDRRTRLTPDTRQMGERESAAIVLRHSVASAIAGSFNRTVCKENVDTSWDDALAADFKVLWKGATGQKSPAKADDIMDKEERMKALGATLSKYKARPLNGIWASPPYLHNGSVATLDDLLKPPAERAREFYLGCADYDTERGGLKCGPSNGGFLYKTTIGMSVNSGGVTKTVYPNSNEGHDFGPKGPSAAEDRRALIEYLKAI